MLSDSARGALDAEEQAERDARSIFIGNVDFATSVEEVQALFADCGEINAITIPVDKYTGRAKGFAYLEFASKVIAAARLVFAPNLPLAPDTRSGVSTAGVGVDGHGEE